MVTFTTTILKFQKMGEKTGWTYIEISAKYARQLKPDTKVSFRVRGILDKYPIEKKALLPMGEGGFILPLDATIRKHIGKKEGDKLKVQLELDERKLLLSADLMTCLKDDPEALKFFKSLPPSHQQYYSKWIESAKTMQTKSKRITVTLLACQKKQTYNEMMRSYKDFSD